MTTSTLTQYEAELLEWAQANPHINLVRQMLDRNQINWEILGRLRNNTKPVVRPTFVSTGDGGTVPSHSALAAPVGTSSSTSAESRDRTQQSSSVVEGEATTDTPTVPVVAELPIACGTYTLPGNGRDYTFRIRIQALDAKFSPGAQVIEYLCGRDNENDYQPFAFIQRTGVLGIWKRWRAEIWSDMIATAQRLIANPFAEDVLASRKCARCGHKLTVKQSIESTYGPSCRKLGLR